MRDDVAAWFDRRTRSRPAWTVDDLVVFLDADLVDVDATGVHFVTSLLGPLLTADGWSPDEHPVAVTDRPPIRDLARIP